MQCLGTYLIVYLLTSLAVYEAGPTSWWNTLVGGTFQFKAGEMTSFHGGSASEMC